jgi:hypothetical protein
MSDWRLEMDSIFGMRRVLACICVVLVAVLAGCGGDDKGGAKSGGGGGSDESAIRDVVIKNATSNDPAICTQIYTDNYLDYNFFGSSKKDPKKCEDNVKDGSPVPESKVKISDLKVTGSKATVIVQDVGEPVQYTLKKESDGWKIDAVDIPTT